MKRCTKCGEEKAVEEFHKSRSTKDGLCYICKMCKAARYAIHAEAIAMKNREYAAENRHTVALNQSVRNARRGGYLPCSATVEELEAAFTGRCDACGVPEVECNGKLCMDHDHNIETNNFRGFLCAACNKAAGYLKDSPEIMRNLAEYIERFKDGSVWSGTLDVI